MFFSYFAGIFNLINALFFLNVLQQRTICLSVNHKHLSILTNVDSTTNTVCTYSSWTHIPGSMLQPINYLQPLNAFDYNFFADQCDRCTACSRGCSFRVQTFNTRPNVLQRSVSVNQSSILLQTFMVKKNVFQLV